MKSGWHLYYSPPPPPIASIRRVQLEEPHTVMLTSSVVEVSIVELWISPLISKTQECAKVVAPKQKFKLQSSLLYAQLYTQQRSFVTQLKHYDSAFICLPMLYWHKKCRSELPLLSFQLPSSPKLVVTNFWMPPPLLGWPVLGGC